MLCIVSLWVWGLAFIFFFVEGGGFFGGQKGMVGLGWKLLQMGPGCFFACDMVDVGFCDAEPPFSGAETTNACAVFLDRGEIVCVRGVT